MSYEDVQQTLIRKYLEVTQQLPPDEQGEYILELNRVAGIVPQPPDPQLPEVLWRALENEEDQESQQDLIRDYLDIIQQLDEPERSERLSALNDRFGAAASAD